MSYSLRIETKGAPLPQMQGGAPGQQVAPPPQPQAGQDVGPTDEQIASHEWAGDVDETGEHSDPANAFATFRGQNGEQAWLDRAEDGTATGWVMDADGTVYRYSDADAWAIDVDDAQMTRTDPAQDDPSVPADGSEEQDPNAAAPEEDPADPSTDQGEMSEGDELDPNADDEMDPAADPNADPTADPNQDPEEDPAHPAIDGGVDDFPHDEQDPNADPSADDGTDEEDPKKKKKQPPWLVKKPGMEGKSILVKHLPGKHNQEEHGNWAHHGGHHKPHVSSRVLMRGGSDSLRSIARNTASPRSSRSRRGSRGASGPGSRGDRPERARPRPGAPATAAPEAKAPASLEHLPERVTTKDLDGVDLQHLTEDQIGELMGRTDDSGVFDALMGEMDRRDNLGDHAEEMGLSDDPPGSLAAEWGAMDKLLEEGLIRPRKNRSPEEAAKEDYGVYVQAQYLKALDACRGTLVNARGEAAGIDEQGLFDGRYNAAQVRAYASEELLRWFAEPGNKRMTWSDFAADYLGWESYAKAKRKKNSRWQSEFG